MSVPNLIRPLRKKETICRIALPMLALLLFVVDAFGADGQLPVIKQLEISGNRRIEKETIEARIESKIGTRLSQDTLRRDIRTLYGLGYFDDIRIEVEPFEGGVKLIFLMDEKPNIASIDFQGNKEIETDVLREKVTLAPGAVANHFLIQDNVESIVSHYHSEGYWHASVLPVIREVSEDTVAVTFRIDEGPKVKIKEIRIEGNDRISDREIKKSMKTRERWFFSFLTGSGIYQKEEMSADLERIKVLYHSRGFIDVKISEPELELGPERKKMFIKLSLSEGEQYSVGEVGFSGHTLFESEQLHERIETASGKIFDRTALRSDIDNVLELYTERGYAMADMRPLIEVKREERLVNIDFSVSEGEIFKIGRIRITGNTKTRDKVIRREIRLDEGDVYNSKLLKRSYQRITNLNYFDTVELNPRPLVSEKLIDIDLNVKEKLTGMITIGGGYSSIDKFIVTGEITQSNLFGKGLYLRLKADISAIRANYNLRITDPWFLDRPLTATFNVYNEEFEFPDYDKKATGGSIGLGKELSEYVKANITYKLESVEITEVGEDASAIVRDQEGERITSSLSPSIWRDSRDNYLDPTSGSKNAIYSTVAGLGGDNYFVKGELDSLWYFPFKWGTTFSLRGRYGYARGFSGRDLPLYERFYVGGIDTVRGLGFGEAGPRDENGEVVGGEQELIFNVEFIFPIEKNIRLKGVVFFDAGKSDDSFEDMKDLRTTAGAGLRWMSPFGPIRLEWGYNLDKKFDESSSKIEFAMGGVF